MDILDAALFWFVAIWLALLGSAGVAYSVWRARTASESASGAIVEMIEEPNDDGSPLQRAIVMFVAEGEEHRVPDLMASNPASYRVGDTVEVWYPPGRPEQAQIGRWRYIWPPLWCATCGWVLVIGGLVWTLT